MRLRDLLGGLLVLGGLARVEAFSLLQPACAGRSTRWSTRSRACVASAAEPAPGEPPAPLESYDDAEQRGFQLYQAGEYERAIRMFELAQTLPGDGVDLKRAKQGGMIGSATAPPNPREWVEDRFATAEQKLIAQYNMACCYAALGDKPRAIELLREYAARVGEPLNQVNEMLVDPDLESVRDELRVLRNEYKVRGERRRSPPRPAPFACTARARRVHGAWRLVPRAARVHSPAHARPLTMRIPAAARARAHRVRRSPASSASAG